MQVNVNLYDAHWGFHNKNWSVLTFKLIYPSLSLGSNNSAISPKTFVNVIVSLESCGKLTVGRIINKANLQRTIYKMLSRSL